ncbi:hypothetical protein [Cardinium endosymbiont of Philonthus spinipes]|uniref:hypothetical protein n=1 Tax=Cardinium endosymbiont of Philonthus spinipes TaxID=3077941 RepID=UPI00313D0B21
MSVVIKELLIQLKVCEPNNQVDNAKNLPSNFAMHPTEQQKLALERDFLRLLEDREAR